MDGAKAERGDTVGNSQSINAGCELTAYIKLIAKNAFEAGLARGKS